MNEPHMAPWWFPANDHPRDKATMDIRITGPAARKVIANGVLVGRAGCTARGPPPAGARPSRWRPTWRSSRPGVRRPRGHLRRPALVRRRLEAARPGARRASMALMRAAAAIAAWTSDAARRLPFESTGGLTTGLPVGFALETQTRPTYPAVPRRASSLVVHELAHQWLGDSVSVEGWRDIWLNEGAATFMEARYTETHGGQSAAAWLRDATPTSATERSGGSGSTTPGRATSSTAPVYVARRDDAAGAAPAHRRRRLLDAPAHLGGHPRRRQRQRPRSSSPSPSRPAART